MNERKKYAIIVAGGSGVRMGTEIPKQFLELDGKPILRHTIERFLSLDTPVEIIVVLPKEMKGWWKDYCRTNDFLPKYVMPSGGISRFHSVKNALKYLPDNALVAVHDGVRPFATKELIENVYNSALENGAAVPAILPVDSVREVENDLSFALARNRIRLVQTPQAFHSEILKKSYDCPYSPNFTDDASVVESIGEKINICEGDRKN
ncbi:MAG: 2-C-methyl-D-erythritol 4-phosphate cytidylyltransferase, partial [Bacteroidales bacterium]|nr:2-C-methyl-D-erythritol 4-phosphate cytidylyltransferase [Bacteroidales bacterium]